MSYWYGRTSSTAYNLSFGEGNVSLRGTLRRFNNAICTSELSAVHFLSKPFDLGYFGLDVRCSKPHCDSKSRNSLLLYCGPLSDSRTLGTPWSENQRITALDDWLRSTSKSKKPEKLSQISKYSSFKNLKRSVATISHGKVDISFKIIGSFVGALWFDWHTAHLLTRSVISLVMPFQYNTARARRIQLCAV